LSPLSQPATAPEAGKGSTTFFLQPPPASTTTVSNPAITAPWNLVSFIITIAPFPFFWSAESGYPLTGSPQCWSRTPPDAPAAGTHTRTLHNPRTGWDRHAAASAPSYSHPHPQSRLPAGRWPSATPDTTLRTRCSPSPWPTADTRPRPKTPDPAA